MKRALLFFCMPLLLLGCSAVQLVPQPGPSTRLATDGQSLVAEKGNLTVSARMQDLQVQSHRMVDNLASFQVTIDNGTATEVNIPLDSFVLIDDEGRQYNAIAPKEVRDIVQRDSAYLVPYPYVGYYYLQDNELAGSQNSMNSSLPYYDQNHPQDIFTQSLPQEAIIPGAKISGLVYFVADLAGMKSVDLRLYRPGSSRSQPADFSFAFSVENK